MTPLAKGKSVFCLRLNSYSLHLLLHLHAFHYIYLQIPYLFTWFLCKMRSDYRHTRSLSQASAPITRPLHGQCSLVACLTDVSFKGRAFPCALRLCGTGLWRLTVLLDVRTQVLNSVLHQGTSPLSGKLQVPASCWWAWSVLAQWDTSCWLQVSATALAVSNLGVEKCLLVRHLKNGSNTTPEEHFIPLASSAPNTQK